MREGDVVRMPSRPDSQTAPNTREWLEHATTHLRHMLPAERERVMVTNDLVDGSGKPVNVARHFDVLPDGLDSLFTNLYGMSHSAQLTGPDDTGEPSPHWPGYDDVLVPIAGDFSLSGKMGMAARDGTPLDADCIVLLPGLLGHNNIRRTIDLADALRANGFHVLAIELRGLGQTNRRHPDKYYTFGVYEAADLLIVSEWLQSQPHVKRTGLVGFCWGANQALITAWYDSASLSHPSFSPRLVPLMRQVSSKGHFEAGIIAFSPVLRFEEVIEALRTPQAMGKHPVLASLQGTVRNRMLLKHHPAPDGNLGRLHVLELSHTEMAFAEGQQDSFDFLRLSPYKGRSDFDKLANCDMPVLIVQAANDPLAPAQAVADLFARLKNPNVAGVITPGGGHVGFAAYARGYYFSLIVNFFDAQRGPVAVHPGGG